MLKVENLSTGYGKKQVLFEVSFEVGKGEIMLLVGGNGSGKSTVLKAIYGLLPLWNTSPGWGGKQGAVFFNGEDISEKPTDTLLKKGLLYIPQKNNLFDDLTVKENLEMAGLTLDRKILPQQFEHVLAIFPALMPHLHRTPMKMSGGERQMLTLAMAMLHAPKMILIDEPFTGLSGKNLEFVMENFKMLNQHKGTTLVIVEHRIKECLGIANSVVGMRLGRTSGQFMSNETINFTQVKSIIF